MRLRHVLLIVVLLAAVLGSFGYLGVNLSDLASVQAGTAMRGYALQFFPPDLSPAHLGRLWQGMLETIAISAMGTLLAAVAGGLLALPASGRFGGTARVVARLLLNFLRSVPELVWAAIMVLAVGLGPFAGALALAWHTTGVIGRLFAETLENAPRQPAEALATTGSGAVAAFMYGTVPNVAPQFVAYTLYRWEMNIRMAAILGVVGAGGLGQMLYVSLSLFQQQQAFTVMLAMLALVIVVDSSSAMIRRRMAAP